MNMITEVCESSSILLRRLGICWRKWENYQRVEREYREANPWWMGVEDFPTTPTHITQKTKKENQ